MRKFLGGLGSQQFFCFGLLYYISLWSGSYYSKGIQRVHIIIMFEIILCTEPKIVLFWYA